MAESHGVSNSDNIGPVSPSILDSDHNTVSKLTANNKYDTSIIGINLKPAWIGGFQSLKCMVHS